MTNDKNEKGPSAALEFIETLVQRSRANCAAVEARNRLLNGEPPAQPARRLDPLAQLKL